MPQEALPLPPSPRRPLCALCIVCGYALWPALTRPPPTGIAAAVTHQALGSGLRYRRRAEVPRVLRHTP
jgi:hypothetical protein